MVLILVYIIERPFRTSLRLCYRLFSDLVFLPAFPHILFHLCTSIVCIDLMEAETICKQWSRHSCASKEHAASSHITFHWLISKNQRGITNFPILLPTSIPGIHSSFILYQNINEINEAEKKKSRKKCSWSGVQPVKIARILWSARISSWNSQINMFTNDITFLSASLYHWKQIAHSWSKKQSSIYNLSLDLCPITVEISRVK